jgi:putative adenylate-forming enzyme
MMIANAQRLLRFIGGYCRAKRGGKITRAKLDQLQARRFDWLKGNVLGKSPFYREYQALDLKDFPIIDKKIHMEHFNEINSVGLDRDEALNVAILSEQSRDFEPLCRGYSVGLSSGTSGNRGLFVVSVLERSEWAGYMVGKLLPMKFQRHRIAFFLRANNNLYETVNGMMMQFRFFDLIQPLEKQVDSMFSYQPTVLIGPGSVLAKIAQLMPELQPQIIISVAEVLEPKDREKIQQVYRVEVGQVYQCTEGFLAATCQHGNLHLNEDIAIIEKHWIDQASGRFSPVVTDLRRTTQPIVRYLLDDILIEDKQQCACGSGMTRLKQIEGRKDDILILNDATGTPVDVYPDFVRNSIISACENLHEYRVVQHSEKLLDIQLAPFTDEHCEQVKDGLLQLWSRLGVTLPEYQFSAYINQNAAGKQRRVQRQLYG